MAKAISRAKRPILQPLPISPEPASLDALLRERSELRSEIASIERLSARIREPKPGDRSLAAAKVKLFMRECAERLQLAQIDLECTEREIEECEILGRTAVLDFGLMG